MKRAILIGLGLTLSSCLYPLVVGGPYASRTLQADVEEIKQLLRHRPPQIEEPAFWAPVREISFERADRAKVTLTDGKAYTQLVVLKRAGRWIIDASSIKTDWLITS